MNENDIFWKKKKSSLIKCFIGTGFFVGITIIMWLFPKPGIFWHDVPLGCFCLFSLINYACHHLKESLKWPPPKESSDTDGN